MDILTALCVKECGWSGPEDGPERLFYLEALETIRNHREIAFAEFMLKHYQIKLNQLKGNQND